MTGKREIVVTPLAVALRGEQGSIALFEVLTSESLQGKVGVWATCGQRKRFPVPAEIRSDVTSGNCRRLLVAVKMPAQYSACTLHVRVRDGVGFKFGSCRIPDEQFRELAPAARNVENDYRYHEWFLEQRADEAELERQRAAAKNFVIKPLFSIVTPIFRTPEQFLVEYLDCLLGQTYGNLELVLVNVSGECPEVDAVLARYDDERLRVIEAPNRTIPENTNVGIEAARGDYVAFVDHDDFVEPDILFRYAEAINEHPQCDLLFCDEDLWDPDWDGGRFIGARFKPGWNPDLLYTHNYVCHMLTVSRWALDRTERSGAETNGAQDYDLTLKVAEVARDVHHVPKVLYHWRKHQASTAANRKSKPYALEAGRVAVQAHFDRVGPKAEVVYGTAPFSYRVHYEAADPAKVSLVLLDSQRDIPAKPAGSVQALGGEIELLACGRGSVNDAVEMARGSIVVLLDNEVETSGEEWLDEITRTLARPDVGCCAPLLLDEDGFVLSAGMAEGEDGALRHIFKGYPFDDVGYMLMLEHARDVDAVPLRCLAVGKEAFEKAGRFDESLAGDRMAADFCERLLAAGFRTVLVPYVQVVSPTSPEMIGGDYTILGPS